MSFLLADDFITSAFFIFKGVGVTMSYTLISLLFGLIGGVILTVFKSSKVAVLKYFSKFYISVIRGTPLLVQLSIVYFGLPMLGNVKISPFTAGIIAFSLNSSAYIAEILRAGLQSIDLGQIEAAEALLVPKYFIWKDILIPQAFKNTLPALVNEMISLLKETAIISVIGEMDIMRRAQLIAAEHYRYFEPLLIAAMCYYFLVLIMGQIGVYFEKKFQYD